MIIVFGILIVVTCGSGASTWHGPVNTCAVAGGPVTMTCQTPASSNSTSWYYTAFGSNSKLLISDGAVLGNGFKEFQVSGDVPGQILTLEVVQMKHAGMYACSALITDKAVKLEESTALLIVLESQPVCTLESRQVKVGVDIEMVCTVNFTGPLPPTMEWKQHGTKDDSDIRDGHVKTASTHNTVTSTARIKADSSRHNSTYSCRTYFPLPSTPLNVNATNVPDYNYTWTSSSVQVIYGPSGVGIVPQQDVFYPGDVLTCVADASPTPVFKWRSLEPGNVFNGRELFIRNSMIRDQPYIFQCHITHVMTSSNLTSHSIKFTVKNNRCISTVADTNLWIIIALVFVCVIIIVAFSVHFVCLKRRSRALASLNGQTRPSDEAVALGLAVNNEPVYSEYTEIPSYNVCREAMDRCHNRPVSNVGYLPMERKSNTSVRGALPEAPGKARASACTKSACQNNNEYMTTDDDVLGPGYAVSASPSTEVQPTMDETSSTYLNLSARKQSSSTDYAVLATTCEEQELLLGEERQPKEPKTIEEKTEEQNDYLLPLSD